MSIGKQRKRPLLSEQSIMNIFTINWTRRTLIEIYIDLSKAHTNSQRISDSSFALITRSVPCLQTDEPRKTLPTFGATPPVSATEIKEAVNRIQSGQKTELDDIASEF
ncbi:uncharacterized protein LOC119648546 [Hermetia illucens]|uniref:uncharacterized protein LOC119648546 n=1 Tax=Hermetia illucens TaxID=343691 RepID=UPI0018CC32A9|nr:uncharacterized protein LOC119648546 [Hermetia illucens]